MKVLIVKQDGSEEVKETGVDSLDFKYLLPTPQIHDTSTNLLVRHIEEGTIYYFVVKGGDEENVFNIESYEKTINDFMSVEEMRNLDLRGARTIIESKLLRRIESELVIGILLSDIKEGEIK